MEARRSAFWNLKNYLDGPPGKPKEGFRVKAGDFHTHTMKSTDGCAEFDVYAGNYFIQEKFTNNFWVLYCNAVKTGLVLTITEKPGNHFPLRVDFDFETTLKVGKKRQYTTKILKDIIRIYQEEIKNIIDPEYFKERMLSCIVLEKTAPRVERKEGGKRKVVKDGFHLHFPRFICCKAMQDEYLREAVTKRMISENVWEGCKFNTSINDIIDKRISKHPWMLYGSTNYKGKHSEPYLYNLKWKHLYDHRLKRISLEKIFEHEMIGRTLDIVYYLPVFLSIKGHPHSTELKSKLYSKISVINHKFQRKRKINKKRTVEEVLADLKYIKDGEIMDMLSDDRADDYNEWMNVGWTLFCIGEGHGNALDMWIVFSRRSEKFVDGECEHQWNTMYLRGKTMGSLLYMAKQDNPEEYHSFKETDTRSLIFASLREPKPTEYDVAMVLCSMYKDRFICADSKKDLWYEFYQHRWHEMDDGIAIKNLLVTEIIKKYNDMKIEIYIRMQSGDATKKEKTQVDRCRAIVSELKKCAFHDRVIKMCKLRMYNPDFSKKRDENRLLLGCENGVIDLEVYAFRDGRPDDYITMSTGIHFQKYNKNDYEVRELDDFLLKVFPNKNRREYFLDFMSSCMEGGNVNKRFLVGTGGGDNGKSITFILLEIAFGEYFGKFPRESLMRGGPNNGASAKPELARVRGKRIMAAQEIGKTYKLDIGFLKEITGNDSFFVRTLFEKGAELRPQFTLIMQCNDPPSIPGNDDATWSRIRKLLFEAKFVKPQDLYKWPVPTSFKEQLRTKRFRADPNFSDILPDLAPVLLWKLFDRFETYKSTGLMEPKEVLDSVDSRDLFFSFLLRFAFSLSLEIYHFYNFYLIPMRILLKPTIFLYQLVKPLYELS